jgi:type I restriction enzyme, S subunit
VSAFPVVPLRTVTVDAQTGPFGSQLHSDEYIDDGIPVINPSSIINSKIVPDSAVTITEETSERLARHRLEIGDLVFARRGELGRAAVTHDQAVGWLCGTGSLRVRTRQSVLDSRFAEYVLQSAKTRAYFEMYAVGSTMANLNTSIVLGLHIPLPSLDEQRGVVQFLDAETARIDALRASRLTQISVLEELELARIGDHLAACETVGPVYAYFDVQLGKMLNAERSSGGNQQPYLRNANVQWYAVDTDDLANMSFEPDEYHRYELRPGDLLVCEGGYVGRSAVWDGRISPCFYQKSLHRVRARGHVPVEWLMYWLRYAKAIGIFDANGNVATIAHLTGEQLAEYRIPIPRDGRRHVAELASDVAAIRETKRKMADAEILLAERRQALITAAVTGGITV